MGLARTQRRLSMQKSKKPASIRQLAKAASAGEVLTQTANRLRTRRYRRGLRGHETEGFAD